VAFNHSSILDIRRVGGGLLRDACRHLGSKGQTCESSAVLNSLPWERHEVIELQDGAAHPSLGTFSFSMCIINLYTFPIHRTTFDIIWSSPSPLRVAALVKVPSVGVAVVKDTVPVTPVSVTVQVRGGGGVCCFG